MLKFFILKPRQHTFSMHSTLLTCHTYCMCMCSYFHVICSMSAKHKFISKRRTVISIFFFSLSLFFIVLFLIIPCINYQVASPFFSFLFFLLRNFILRPCIVYFIGWTLFDVKLMSVGLYKMVFIQNWCSQKCVNVFWHF